MLKVQSAEPGEGWIMATRAGDTLDRAWSILAGYRRRYPGARHRLVSVAGDGAVTVIPDDAAALALADELAQLDE